MIIREYTRNQAPETARPFRKYSIGDVSIAWDKDLKLHRKVLEDLNTIRPGAMYSEKDVNNTYSRLSALKLFNGVNISLAPRDSADVVDCDIILSRSRTQGFKANLEGSTNSSGLIGISPQLSYFHRNIFHGNSLFTGPSVPKTEINASYTLQDRPEYRRTMISTSLGYSGSLSRGRFLYQAYPFQAKIVRLTDIDPTFYGRFNGNQFLLNAYIDHFDIGSGAMVFYSTSADINPKDSYRYIRLQLDASGNILSLFNHAMATDRRGKRLIWGIPYSQYVRSELTLGNTIFFGRDNNQALAFRLLGG